MKVWNEQHWNPSWVFVLGWFCSGFCSGSGSSGSLIIWRLPPWWNIQAVLAALQKETPAQRFTIFIDKQVKSPHMLTWGPVTSPASNSSTLSLTSRSDTPLQNQSDEEKLNGAEDETELLLTSHWAGSRDAAQYNKFIRFNCCLWVFWYIWTLYTWICDPVWSEQNQKNLSSCFTSCRRKRRRTGAVTESSAQTIWCKNNNFHLTQFQDPS